jgi:hypothetical protein
MALGEARRVLRNLYAMALQPTSVFSLREFKRKGNVILVYVNDVHFEIPMIKI